MAVHRGIPIAPAAVRITTNLVPVDTYRCDVSYRGQDYDQICVLGR